MVESVNIWTCDTCGETAKANINCVPPNWRRVKISATTRYEDDGKEYTVFGREKAFDMCPSCAKEVSDILIAVTQIKQ